MENCAKHYGDCFTVRLGNFLSTSTLPLVVAVAVVLAFALFEMKLVLASVLPQYDLALKSNRPVKPVLRGITLAPAGGKWLVATDKKHQVPQLVNQL